MPLKILKRIICILMLFMSLASCRTIRETQTEYLNVYHTDTIREVRTLRDSIFVSERVNTYTRNDTVFVEKEVLKYKDRQLTDTVHWVKTVTITRKEYYTKEKEVNVLKWWQEALMWIGGAGLLWAVFSIVYRIKR